MKYYWWKLFYKRKRVVAHYVSTTFPVRFEGYFPMGYNDISAINLLVFIINETGYRKRGIKYEHLQHLQTTVGYSVYHLSTL